MKTPSSSNDIPTLAQRLREERLSRGWSIEDVAEQIGASAVVVEQLESDGTSQLPGVYRDAYLKRYLRVLEMDEYDLGEPAVPDLRVVLPMPKRRLWLERSIAWARYALASLIIIPPLVWFSIHHSTSWIAGGFDDLEGSRAIETSSPSVRRLQASQVPARSLSESVSEVLSQNQTGSENAPRDNESLLGAPEPLVNVLKVYLTEDSWVELKDAEGNRLEHNLLRRDREYSYQGEPPFEVFVGLGSALTFELNGQPINHLEVAQGEGLMAFYIDAAGQVSRKQ